MLEKQKIIHMYIAGGKSLREISLELGVSRQAVTKIVREYESALLSDNPDEAVDAVLTTRPQYHKRSEALPCADTGSAQDSLGVPEGERAPPIRRDAQAAHERTRHPAQAGARGLQSELFLSEPLHSTKK